MIDLSVVIVSWNVSGLLRRCLGSILGTARSEAPGGGPGTGSGAPRPALAVEVIVVDNGSTDGSVSMVREEFPSVRVIPNPDNRGFPAANNQGIAIARGRYAIILNPDTEVIDAALSTMVAYADAHPSVGVVGPQLLFPDGSVQPSRYRFPTLATAAFESTWLQPYAPRRILDQYYVRDQPDDVAHDVDWVRGAALMTRRETIEQVGPLDEGFFMYSEELDWCRRVRDADWRVVYLPDAQIVHHEGKSSEQAVAARHVNFQTSKVRYFQKHHGKLAGETLRFFLLGNYAWQIVIEGSKWLVGHRRDLRAQRLAAYSQVLGTGLRPGAHIVGNLPTCGLD
jgi:GT2 family glycosyltransferase